MGSPWRRPCQRAQERQCPGRSRPPIASVRRSAPSWALHVAGGLGRDGRPQPPVTRDPSTGDEGTQASGAPAHCRCARRGRQPRVQSYLDPVGRSRKPLTRKYAGSTKVSASSRSWPKRALGQAFTRHRAHQPETRSSSRALSLTPWDDQEARVLGDRGADGRTGRHSLGRSNGRALQDFSAGEVELRQRSASAPSMVSSTVHGLASSQAPRREIAVAPGVIRSRKRASSSTATMPTATSERTTTASLQPPRLPSRHAYQAVDRKSSIAVKSCQAGRKLKAQIGIRGTPSNLHEANSCSTMNLGWK